MYDKDRCATATPQQFAGWMVNVIVKLIGKWQTPDGSASGLNLMATDILSASVPLLSSTL